MDKLDQKLDRFFASLSRSSAIVEEKEHFPFPIDQLSAYYFPDLVKRLLRVLKANPKINKKELAKRLRVPTGIRIELLNLLEAAKLANLEKEDRIKIAEFFLNLLEIVCKRDPFGNSRTNPILSNSEVKNLVKKIKFKTAGEENSRLIGEICVSLNLISWGLYTDLFPAMFFEYQGPYDVSYKFGGKSILVVRDFVDLKPAELWPEVKNWKYKTILLDTVYKDLNFEIDFFGHHFPDKSTVAALEYFAIFADGKPVENIKEFACYLEKIASEQTKRLRILDFEVMKEKFITTHHYQLKPLFEMVGEDWRPEKGLLKTVKNKRLRIEEIWPPKGMSKEKAFKVYKEYIDPRID